MDEERLVVALEARIAEFEKRMKKAERTGSDSYRRLRRGSQSATRAMESDMVRSTGRINQALATSSARIGTFSKAMVAGMAGGVITAAFAGVTSNIGEVVRGLAEIGDEAKRAGVSLEAFQEWKYVAEQNRIGVDALTDGLKELNLRADEFIITGGGSAAEAFQRLGFSAAQLREGLKDPSELLLEIIGRLEDLDQAAQIRIADEVFGGTAGERFVELIGQGEAGLRRTAERAHQVGAVMDADMIEKAQELDRRFADLQTRVGSFFKSAAVESADFVTSVVTLREELDNMFRSYEQAKGLLGDGVAETLREDADAATDNAEQIGILRQLYEGLGEDAYATAAQLEQAAAQLYALGEADAAATLADAATEMRRLSDGMNDGTVEAADFEAGLSAVSVKAVEAFDALEDIDKAQFSGVIAQVGGLAKALVAAIAKARELRSALPGGVQPSKGFEPDLNRFSDPLAGLYDSAAPTSSLRPRAAPPTDELLPSPRVSTGGGGGGGGTDRTSARIERLVDDLKTERELLEEWYADSLELLNEATDQQLEALGGRYEAMERLEREHHERMADLRDEANGVSVQSILKGGEDILGALGSVNERALKISRVFGAAEAWISTLRGAAKELEKGTFGFATAAAVIAKGAAFVAAIQGVKGGSGGSGGAPAGVSGAAAEPPPLPVQRVEIDWRGPGADAAQTLLDTLNSAAKKGYRLDARIVGR